MADVMWVASYDIRCDGFVASEIAERDKQDWHIPISDEVAVKLKRIGHLPGIAMLDYSPAQIECCLLAYSEPAAA